MKKFMLMGFVNMLLVSGAVASSAGGKGVFGEEGKKSPVSRPISSSIEGILESIDELARIESNQNRQRKTTIILPANTSITKLLHQSVDSYKPVEKMDIQLHYEESRLAFLVQSDSSPTEGREQGERPQTAKKGGKSQAPKTDQEKVEELFKQNAKNLFQKHFFNLFSAVKAEEEATNYRNITGKELHFVAKVVPIWRRPTDPLSNVDLRKLFWAGLYALSDEQNVRNNVEGQLSVLRRGLGYQGYYDHMVNYLRGVLVSVFDAKELSNVKNRDTVRETTLNCLPQSPLKRSSSGTATHSSAIVRVDSTRSRSIARPKSAPLENNPLYAVICSTDEDKARFAEYPIEMQQAMMLTKGTEIIMSLGSEVQALRSDLSTVSAVAGMAAKKMREQLSDLKVSTDTLEMHVEVLTDANRKLEAKMDEQAEESKKAVQEAIQEESRKNAEALKKMREDDEAKRKADIEELKKEHELKIQKMEEQQKLESKQASEKAESDRKEQEKKMKQALEEQKLQQDIKMNEAIEAERKKQEEQRKIELEEQRKAQEARDKEYRENLKRLEERILKEEDARKKKNEEEEEKRKKEGAFIATAHKMSGSFKYTNRLNYKGEMLEAGDMKQMNGRGTIWFNSFKVVGTFSHNKLLLSGATISYSGHSITLNISGTFDFELLKEYESSKYNDNGKITVNVKGGGRYTFSATDIEYMDPDCFIHKFEPGKEEETK